MATHSTSAKAMLALVALTPFAMAQMTTTLNIPFMAQFDIDPSWTPALNGTLLGVSGDATTISLNCPTIESYCQTDGGGQQTITISGSSFGLGIWSEESQTMFAEDCEVQAYTDVFGDTTTTATCTATLSDPSDLQNVQTTFWVSAPVYPVTVSGQWPESAATTAMPGPPAVPATTTAPSSSSSTSTSSSSHSPVPTTKMLLPFEPPFWSAFATYSSITFNASVLGINNKLTTMSIACLDSQGLECNAVATQLMTFGPGVYDLYLNGPDYFTSNQTCAFSSTITAAAAAAVSSNITALCTESYNGPSAVHKGVTTTTETDFTILTVLASGAALATSTSTIATKALTTSATTTSAATTSHTGAALRPSPGVEAFGMLFGGTAAAVAAGVAGIVLL